MLVQPKQTRVSFSSFAAAKKIHPKLLTFIGSSSAFAGPSKVFSLPLSNGRSRSVRHWVTFPHRKKEFFLGVSYNGGFPQQPWGFPTKNDHFGVFGGYHYLRKHPYNMVNMCLHLPHKNQPFMYLFEPINGAP